MRSYIFTDEARRILLEAAPAVARSARARAIAPSHIAVPLLRERRIGELLARVSVEAALVLATLEHGSPAPPRRRNGTTPQFSSEAMRVVEAAMKEAEVLQSKHVGVEHLLLGILRLNRPRVGILLWLPR